MGELTQEQRTEMHAERRRLHGVGDPSRAASISSALLEGRYFMGEVVVPEPELKVPKPNAKKEAWVKYALAVSNIEPEIIESATRTDIQGMLKANGFLKA